jgi:anti-sigma regulatory factor (Ser/Thr protein kinase)
MSDYGSPSLISLKGSLAGELALVNLLGPDVDAEQDSDLMIAAGGVTHVDVLTGAAMRMRIDRHLRGHPERRITITPPRNAAVAERLLDLLYGLPERVSVAHEHARPSRGRFALLPATQITEPDALHPLGEFALEACEAARLSAERANVVALAAMELGENALRYAGDAACPAVIAATVSGRERLVRLAVLDAGSAISEASSPERRLGSIPDPEKGAGFLSELLRLGQRDDLRVAIQILSGTGRLTWDWSAHRTERGIYVPGTTVLVRIDPSPIRPATGGSGAT